jgi:hypothetical protein
MLQLAWNYDNREVPQELYQAVLSQRRRQHINRA